MANVEFRRISKSFGEVAVLKDIDLEIESGTFTVFVGPSGCGKSTLLRIVAGLEVPTGGDLLFDGVRMNDVEPARREIAMVFQSYALYPHMRVDENMAFSLKLRKESKQSIDAAVKAAAQLLDIEHLLSRRPRELSGGQRQRVAIGRAIVRKPKVFLFDEPLSNLDAELRTRMRYELVRLHQALQATMIYVTHDQVEAMTLADRIVVLNQGRIEQIGAPMQLYHRPANTFVAGFIGSPKMNLLAGEVVEANAAGAKVRLPSGVVVRTDADAARAKVGDSVTLGIRPEDFAIGAGDDDRNMLEASVHFVERLGGITYAYATGPAAATLTVRLPEGAAIEQGARIDLAVRPPACHLFAADGAAFPRRHAVS